MRNDLALKKEKRTYPLVAGRAVLRWKTENGNFNPDTGSKDVVIANDITANDVESWFNRHDGRL